MAEGDVVPDLLELFNEALEQPPGSQRAAVLGRLCGSDHQLRARLETLLRASERAGSFLADPVSPLPDVFASEPLEAAGSMIGPYKLLESIGEGGMGVVYVAEQAQPVRRKVALKIIKPGMDTKQVISRFEAERQALALMDHPNIARVLDGGTTEKGLPYFVMELVRGIAITDYCDLEHLTIPERLELFVQVCRAVQHAHQKGIIHRDLKPSNILITVIDGAPVPKIIDFGVAKATGQSLTERTIYTGFAQILGTPLYMSPEQAALSGVDVDTRSDIYALGVLLYELLTGTTPFDRETLSAAALDEMRRIVREEEPPRPSMRLSTLGATLTTVLANRNADARNLHRAVRGELDWIVMKALEKDRRRRYESASDFAADVARYLSDEPVQACPPSAGYRLSKYARRNRVALTTATLIVCALVTGTAVSAWQAVRATRAEKQADVQRKVAEQHSVVARLQTMSAEQARTDAERERNTAGRNLYIADMRLGLVDWTAGNLARLSQKLSNYLPQPGRDDLRGWEWYYLLSLCHQDERTLTDHSGRVCAIGWSPDGRYVASAGKGDGTVQVWDPASWRRLRTFSQPGTVPCCVAWSPDSRCVAWGGHDSAIYVCDVKSGDVKTLRGHKSAVWGLAWSADGSRLASSGMYDTVEIWDVAAGACIRTFDDTHAWAWSVAWSPDGSRVAAAGAVSGLTVWDVDTGRVVHRGGPRSHSRTLEWSRDGKRLVLGGEEGDIVIYQTADWSEAVRWHGHAGLVTRVAWEPEGDRLASSGADSLIRVWDPADGSSLLTQRGHRNQVSAVAWEPNGRRLVSAGVDGTVKVWSASSSAQPRRLARSSGGALAIAWGDEPGVLCGFEGKAGAVTEWDAATGQRRRTLTVPAGSKGRFSSNGRQVAILADPVNSRRIVIGDPRSGQPSPDVPALLPTLLALSPDATQLALGGAEGLVVVDRFQKNEVVLRSWIVDLCDASWSPDGRLLAVAGAGSPQAGRGLPGDGWVHLFDTVKREKVWEQRHGTTSAMPATAVAWSRDGKRLVSADHQGRAVVWEVSTGRKVLSAQVHATQVNALAWSPDGQRIASVSKDQTLLVWDPTCGEELLRFDLPGGEGIQCQWEPSGRRLAALDSSGTILVWDTTAGHRFLNSDESVLERTHAQQQRKPDVWARRPNGPIPFHHNGVIETLKTTLRPGLGRNME